MKNEKKNYRFFALLNLFNFSMAGMIFSPNLFQTYFFWELLGVVSYLLIGFEYFNPDKSIASKKTFIINRIGDTALITAILSCSYFIYAYSSNKSLVTLSFIDMNTISTLVYAYASTPLFQIICLLFMLGAFVKSAQFPFFTWLQDAMQAKLPVSALLHSATMVASGVYIILRLTPFFVLDPNLLKVVALIGILTALLCSFCACAQTSPKKVLAYSTSAQLGLMCFAIGILNIKAAVAFFIAHAFIKSLLFLTLPNDGEKWNYLKFVLFLISGLSLSGILLSGMVAKEMIVNNVGNFGLTLFSIVSFLTAFYIIKIALITYDKHGIEKCSISKLELLAIISLFIFNIVLYIYLHINAQYKVAEPFWAALTAWVCVYIFYLKSAFWRVPVLYPLAYNGLYVDKLYSECFVKIYESLAHCLNKLDLKVLANYKLCVGFAKLSVRVFNFIEINIINAFVGAIVKAFKKCSLINVKAQNGNIQRYNIYAFVILTIILTSLILGYTAIIVYMGGLNG